MGSYSAVETLLAEYLNEHYGDMFEKPITGSDVKTNTQSIYLKPIES